MRIGVAGLAGRMGSLVAEEVRAAGATLAGGTVLDGETHAGAPLSTNVFATVEDMAAACDAIVDFTHPSAVTRHAAAITGAQIGWVLGTTGLSVAHQQEVASAALCSAVVQAANFSPGVNLVLAVAEQLARALPASVYDAEIVEMHHRQKVDAPSGTALALGQAVAAGRGVTLADVTQSGRDGYTGPRLPGAIGFAVLRGGQVVGDHTVLFAGGSEHIELTHKAFDRRVFAAGAVRAALWLQAKPAGLYTMRDVLGLGSL